MYWIFPLILSLICAAINPHVGLFGLFIFIQLLFFFVIEANVIMRVNLSRHKSGFENDFVDKAAKMAERLLKMRCAASVILFVITSVVSIVVWLLTSGRLIPDYIVSTTPISIFANEDKDVYGF